MWGRTYVCFSEKVSELKDARIIFELKICIIVVFDYD